MTTTLPSLPRVALVVLRVVVFSSMRTLRSGERDRDRRSAWTEEGRRSRPECSSFLSGSLLMHEMVDSQINLLQHTLKILYTSRNGYYIST